MKKHEHLPFEVILSATEGEPEAVETVLKFYDGYISKLCLRKLYDEYGNVCMVVDADLKSGGTNKTPRKHQAVLQKYPKEQRQSNDGCG